MKSLNSYDELKNIVANASIPLVVDFWAPWCGPCQAMQPILEKMSADMAGVMGFAKMNIDDHQEMIEIGKIEEIPTMVVFKGGKEVARIVGMYGESALTKTLMPYCDK